MHPARRAPSPTRHLMSRQPKAWRGVGEQSSSAPRRTERRPLRRRTEHRVACARAHHRPTPTAVTRGRNGARKTKKRPSFEGRFFLSLR